MDGFLIAFGSSLFAIVVILLIINVTENQVKKSKIRRLENEVKYERSYREIETAYKEKYKELVKELGAENEYLRGGKNA